MFSIKNEELKEIRDSYPVGSRVRLIKMDDVQAPPIGSYGRVRGVDDTGTILVSWDVRSSLGVVYREDACVRVKEFKSGKEMYELLTSGRNLYSKSRGLYVSEYNDAHALCCYSLNTNEVIEILKKKAHTNEYWGAYLGIGGSILEDSEYNNEDYRYSEDENMRNLYLKPSLDFCKELFNLEDWVDTEDVTEEYVLADF